MKSKDSREAFYQDRKNREEKSWNVDYRSIVKQRQGG